MMCVVIINTIIFLSEVVYGMFLNGNIGINRGSVNLISIIISFILSCGLFWVVDKFRYNINIENLESLNMDSLISKSIEQETKDINIDFESKEEEYSMDDSTLYEKIENEEIEIDDNDIYNLINETPKKKIDRIYHHNKDNEIEEMVKNLNSSSMGRNDINESRKDGIVMFDKKSFDEFSSKIKLDDNMFSGSDLNDQEDSDVYEEFSRERNDKSKMMVEAVVDAHKRDEEADLEMLMELM
ncbi:hypothetical protein D3C81_742590 [compost metagenome]